MARIDPLDAETINECQRGIRWEWKYAAGGSGSFCRKRDLCMAEKRCHFVSRFQYHAERAWAAPIPGRIVWSRGFDYDPKTLPLFGAA